MLLHYYNHWLTFGGVYSVPDTVVSALLVRILSIFTTTLCGRDWYYLYYVDGEI